MADDEDTTGFAKLKGSKQTKRAPRYFDESSVKASTSDKHETNKPLERKSEDKKKKSGKKRASAPDSDHVDRKRGKETWDSDEEKDPFPGEAPIKEEALARYTRGEGNKIKIRAKTAGPKLERKTMEKKFHLAAQQAARAELLLGEDHGYLEASDDEDTSQLSQTDIADAVDISAAQKHFDLKLDKFGPYRMNYTRNGRFLVIAGRRGHVAALDWMSKKLLCEINVMEGVHDVKWLHVETMFAVAQQRWTYIYDHQGVELHCLKKFNNVLKMEFLPYHFLLATASSTGFLQYLDVSLGKELAAFNVKQGCLNVMTQNPQNAVVHLGHANGTVTLWSPNVKEPLAKLLSHVTAVRSIAVDKTGTYMATSGQDRYMKVFDIRALKPLQVYRMSAGAGQLAFSQTGLVAAALGNVVEVYKDCCSNVAEKPYLTHRLRNNITGLQFCPYEDVLGVGHQDGFTSLLIPGAGEANFDAFENNPYQTKKQRRDYEVKMLLEKIQPEMIGLDPGGVGQVSQLTAQEVEKREQEAIQKKFEPAKKKKGRSKSLKTVQRTKGVEEEWRRMKVRQKMREEEEKRKKQQKDHKKKDKWGSALDRFQKKEN
ncbi:WD repeat-containing protein 46-like [Branchiostoma floridae]|uniref:WD repeat-containing protein 46 n=1 Tax=Branchiostoma floridae TaxID=7739 RepID=C3Y0U0_BRAFL|nr:WD repeat-containing protein 46-like [Branchiostoma floridae]|eukprot:XP_002610063.1 hypothetical protein BRAFLDRAFT_89920 [Branchiostoma floridae]